MRYSVSAVVLSVVFLLLICPTVYAGGVSAIVPLENWTYPVIDRLVATGVIQSSLSGNRPFTRSEVARLVVEAEQNLSITGGSLIDQRSVNRLKKEFSDEIQNISVESAKSYFQPVSNVDLRYVYQDGQPSTIPRVSAQQFSLNYNNGGRDYSEHSNVELQLSTRLRVKSWFLMDWRSSLNHQEYAYTEPEKIYETRHSKLAFQFSDFEVSVGRQSLWWGRGRHGSLILTNNTEPLDMLRITNPTPVIAPWILSSLGPMRLDVFWSRLSGNRTISEPYFAGVRIDVKPFPWFELGGSRCIIFGGEGRPDIDLSDFLTILSGKNLSGEEDTSNSVAAIDFRMNFSSLWNVELYGEAGGEDEAGGWIANSAYLVGLYFPYVEPTETVSLRLEYADLSYVDNNSPVWYRHGIYKSGYTYRGKLLGHHVGGGAEDLSGELRFDAGDGWCFSVLIDYEQRGADQPVLEKHLQSGFELGYNGERFPGFRVKSAVDRVTNANYLSGNNDKNYFVDFSIFTQW